MRITEFKLSVFWAETNLALLERDPPPDAPLAFLGRYIDYVEAFDDAQYRLRAGRETPVLSPPWSQTKGEHFWTYYTGGRSNAQVKGNNAWRRVIPFRALLPVAVEVTSPLWEVLLDVYFYPHGIAFLANLTWQQRPGKTVEEVAQEAFNLRHRQRYGVTWDGEADPVFGNVTWPAAKTSNLSLSRLADHAMAVAHQAAFGRVLPRGVRTAPEPEPFSVVGVLAGDGVDLTQSPQGGGRILAALHALADGQPVRPGAGLPPFDESVRVGLGEDAGEADLLYGERRGRVIWYPSRFTAGDPNIRFSLDCYHNNLALASLQTESLCGLAQAVAGLLERDQPLSVHQREVARYATNMLGLLYGGHRDTYRSRSPQRQIEQNGWQPAVNRVRQHYNNPPLH